MGTPLNLHSANGVIARAPGIGQLIASGQTVPADGGEGYAGGCVFIHTDGGVGTVLYQNEGSNTSCDFNAIAAMTAAQEALVGATAGTATASKAVILDANAAVDAVKTAALSIGVSGVEVAVTSTPAELNQLDGAILADMTPGTGVSTGTGTVCEHRVTKIGGLFKTEILLDLTGLNDGGTAADIIGKDGGTVNSHIGQILAAVNGTIIAGRILCIEVPAGGNVDVDLFHADGGVGAQDANIDTADTGSAVQLLNHGDWAAGEIGILTAFPPTTEYLYLACGVNTGADYTGGIFLIELWGV